jgi:hypothetical protein
MTPSIAVADLHDGAAGRQLAERVPDWSKAIARPFSLSSVDRISAGRGARRNPRQHSLDPMRGAAAARALSPEASQINL